MTHRKTVGVLSGLGLDWIGINLLCFARPWACHSSTCQIHNLNIQVIVLGLAKDSDSFIHSFTETNPRKNHCTIKKSTEKWLYNKEIGIWFLYLAFHGISIGKFYHQMSNAPSNNE